MMSAKSDKLFLDCRATARIKYNTISSNMQYNITYYYVLMKNNLWARKQDSARNLILFAKGDFLRKILA